MKPDPCLFTKVIPIRNLLGVVRLRLDCLCGRLDRHFVLASRLMEGRIPFLDVRRYSARDGAERAYREQWRRVGSAS
jgi:hypothetical protein